MKHTYNSFGGYGQPAKPKDFPTVPKELLPKEEESDDDLMCQHQGCTNRWTVQGPHGSKCSKHYWSDAGASPAVRTMKDWTGQHYPGDMKVWARRLQDAHNAGWELTEYLIWCYKTALRIE